MNISLHVSKVNIAIPEHMSKVQGQKLGKFAANELHKLMHPLTPYRTGVLAGSAMPRAWAVWYPVSYAIYPYRGHNMVNWTKAGTGAEWDKKAIAERGDEYIAAIQAYVDSGALGFGG